MCSSRAVPPGLRACAWVFLARLIASAGELHNPCRLRCMNCAHGLWACIGCGPAWVVRVRVVKFLGYRNWYRYSGENRSADVMHGTGTGKPVIGTRSLTALFGRGHTQSVRGRWFRSISAAEAEGQEKASCGVGALAVMSNRTFCRAKLERSRACTPSDGASLIDALLRGHPHSISEDVTANLISARDALRELDAALGGDGGAAAAGPSSSGKGQKQSRQSHAGATTLRVSGADDGGSSGPAGTSAATWHAPHAATSGGGGGGVVKDKGRGQEVSVGGDGEAKPVASSRGGGQAVEPAPEGEEQRRVKKEKRDKKREQQRRAEESGGDGGNGGDGDIAANGGGSDDGQVKKKQKKTKVAADVLAGGGDEARGGDEEAAEVRRHGGEEQNGTDKKEKKHKKKHRKERDGGDADES